MGGENDKAQERDTLGDRTGLGPVLVDSQAQGARESNDLLPPAPEGRFVLGKEERIIHITQVSPAFQLPLDELIQLVQVAIGPELRGQVADGQAPGPTGGQQVVAGEPDHLVFLREDPDTALQDTIYQPHRILIGNEPPQDAPEDGVIYAGEELAYITGEHIGIATGKVGAAVQGPMGALAHPVGVGIVDETAFKDGLDDLAESVVDDPVTEGRGGDEAALGLVDVEAMVRARAIGLGEQFILELNQVVL